MSRKSKSRRGAEAELAKIYGSLPRLRCQGKCHTSCGPIPMTPLEQARIEEALGGPLPFHTPHESSCMSCPLLTPDKRCGVYEQRPLICRLWGMVDDPFMTCPYGCRPERMLTDRESRRLLARVDEVSRRWRKADGM